MFSFHISNYDLKAYFNNRYEDWKGFFVELNHPKNVYNF